MRFELLGPLRVVHDGVPAGIGARKVETLLGTLLVRAEQVVPVDDLLAELWDGDQPRNAVAAVHVYVSQLRKALAALPGASTRIETRAPGYLLRRGRDGTDVEEFADRLAEGRRRAADGDHARTVAVLEEAVRMWRGPALCGLGRGPVLGGHAVWLEEARLECEEALVESRLALGQHRQVVGRLYELTTRHPLRETLQRQLMTALYRSGRRADALKTYERVSCVLREELGLMPGSALQTLQRAVLAGEPPVPPAWQSSQVRFPGELF